MSNQLLTTEQLADLLNVTVLTIYRHVKTDPHFPTPIRISRRVLRFDPADVDAYISSRRQRTAA